MPRAYNFCAGPATIPEAVLQRIQNELLDWRSSGTSVMEISHRSDLFIEKVLQPAEANLRKLLNIPNNYKVLFISCGTSHQFTMVPLNLLGLEKVRKEKIADYFDTGIWSGKAIKEALRYGKVNIVSSSKDNHYTHILPSETWCFTSSASYVHYTPNETINGLSFSTIPETGDIPLVADMSSCILNGPLEINRFGLIYAGAQKNIGVSGLTILIIREDLIGHASSITPTLYNYETYSNTHSLHNTPSTFAIYVAGLVFEWLLERGGLSLMAENNHRKANKLYSFMENTDFYHCPIHKTNRSLMNVIFYLPNPSLDKLFVQEAAQHGLLNLKGHKAIGGIRASIYNAMPEEGIDTLISFMKNFESQYG